ncbi:MAG: hypothetical protein PHY93_07050 [Bacteriovorax sp.]|nr:hypothetical protein [Bacteriovorax sp.]
MNKPYTLALIIILSTPAFSAEKAPDCIREMKTTDGPLANLDKTLTSCGYMEGLTNLKGQKEAHQKAIYEKLSSKLSKKINQNSEETALLTNYFYSNGADLSMNNTEVKKSCNLPSLKNIETCGGKKQKGAFYEMKLNALKKSLNPSGEKSKLGDGLYGILADKYVKNMGIANLGNKEKSLQCPLDGGISPFILSSQLDELSAQDIINGVKSSNDAFGAAFDSYAQLKFLKSAGKEAVAEFKKYVLEKSNNKDISAKDYIAKFFLREDIQKKYLAPTLANQCKSINDNINRFLCEDLTELGSTDSEVSTKMFDGLDIGPIDDQFGVDKTNMDTMTAYGLQCLAQEKKKAPVDKYVPKEKEEKLDDWYNQFSSNMRPEESDNTVDKIKEKFCADYTCTSEKSKNSPSCKLGGPLLSGDMKVIYGCPAGELCKSGILKSIDYLAGIEKIKTSSGFESGSLSSSPRTDDVKKAIGIFPDFAANYLGVEGTLKALSLPLTLADATIDDFKVRNLETTPPPYQPPTSNHTEYAKNDKVDPGHDSAPNIPYFPSVPVASAPMIPSYFPPQSNDKKKIEGVTGKTDSDHWTDDIVDTTKKDKEIKATTNDFAKTDVSNSSVSKNSEYSKEQFEEYKKGVNRELSANRSRMSAISSELNKTQQELASQRAEMERRLSDVERRRNEIKESSNPKDIAESRALKKEADTLKNEISNLIREPAATKSGGGVIVTPENLKTLNEEELQKRGVNVEESFVISIKIKDKTGKGEHLVNVPVIRHSSNGKSYLIPRYDGKNEEIIKAIEKSPLFYDFIKVVKTKMKSFSNLRDVIKGQ